MNVKKHWLIKLIFFLALIAVPIFILSRAYNSSRRKTPIYTFFREASEMRDTAIYFIGSSRVQLGVDPTIVSQYAKKTHIYNAGVSAGTFLSNCIIAKRLMESTTPKLLFIELSPMQPNVPNYILKHKDELGLNVFGTANSLLKNRSIWEKVHLLCQLANQYLSSKIFIVDEVRNLFSKSVETAEALFGFAPKFNNGYHSTLPFLKPADFETYRDTTVVNEYKKYIDVLINEGYQSNTKIVFFLPVTYRSNAEKAIVLPLYKALPDNEKVPVSKEFLTEMSHSENLYDAFHLNYSGAKVYSKYLGEHISSFINK